VPKSISDDENRHVSLEIKAEESDYFLVGFSEGDFVP